MQKDNDNGDKYSYDIYMHKHNYCDSGINVKQAFGKVISADEIVLYITELTAWEICMCYEWDEVEAIHGYITGRFNKPSDLDIISVMQFYQAKNAFKAAREEYYLHRTINNENDLISLGIPETIVNEMKSGTLSENDVEATYLGLKADLNAIFGISCSNQYRRSTELGTCGIEYIGNFGICNAPKTNKVWYQFGQRIVGWSRIAQICVMFLTEQHIDTVINGDTDSIKVVADKENIALIEKDLKVLNNAIDRGKKLVCNRVKLAYPHVYDSLDGIGYYVHEFTTDRFCASWNKAYVIHKKDSNGKRHFEFTLAGIPTKQRTNDKTCFIGLNGYVDRLYELGMTYEEICNLFLGYNVTFANDLIKLNSRSFPEWGEIFEGYITDYKGETYKVVEPASLALYPMSKTINDTSIKDNAANLLCALKNNPNVNQERKLIFSGGVLEMEGIADVL